MIQGLPVIPGLLNIEPQMRNSPINPTALLGLAVFFILLFWAAYALRRWAAARGGASGVGFIQSKYVKVLDTIGLPGGGALVLVQWGERALLLSVGDKKASLVAELPMDSLSPLCANDAPPANTPLTNLGAKLGDLLRKKGGRKNKTGGRQQDGFGPLLSRISQEQAESPDDALAQIQRRMDQRLQQRQKSDQPGEETHRE